MAFDSLSYARHLREHGVPTEQAEAHADAARQFIMSDLATKGDLLSLKTDLTAAMDTQALRLTLRLGLMLATGIGLLAAIIKLS